MLPALPVEKISARGPDMAGAGREQTPSGKTSKRAAGRHAAAAAPAGGPVGSAAELPVRSGEERWTDDELAEVRAALEREVVELGAEIAAAESQIAEGDSSEGAGDDQADAGAKTYEREHEMALAHNSRDLLAQNERAIQRMDAGTYGICERCGKPIGKARLQAYPRATLCVSCKSREERR